MSGWVGVWLLAVAIPPGMAITLELAYETQKIFFCEPELVPWLPYAGIISGDANSAGKILQQSECLRSVL